ncbi:class IV adenylate cyclase [Pseudodesulfovibrio tunisiensis]|uniref:class IV adenylate cyclase n=1 Tax=Pseudodesulfovibrio tunisiensis TaxID=463192 RepID=UPI001FB42457|nr:class IV adenylate cyclase [Pseudodesulfovibrio tunisiensis]
MSLECEVKFPEVDPSELAARLVRAGAESLGRYLERNLVFDDASRSLREASILLRLRSRQGESVLTVKRPPDNPVPSSLKVFEELETHVADFQIMRAILEALGYSVAFGYDKVRARFRFMDCVVCVDELPFGCFAEIEGSEETVWPCARVLGLERATASTETYHALNRAHRERNGLKPDENFTFSRERLDRIRLELENL